MDLVLGQHDAHHRQPAPEVRFDRQPNGGKLSLAMMGRDRDRGHPGAGKQRGKFLPITEHERRTQGVGRSLTRDPLKQRHLGRVRRRVVKAVPHSNGHVAPGSQDPQHFAEGSAPIREEH
ncbi:MAG: hypothetical protein HY335_01720 [Deinococcus sp.]|nr:hypothetical protein [Deinococcus sp.]